MTVLSLHQRLAEELSDKAGVALAISIFNTANLEDISNRLEHYCQQAFQQTIVDCSLVYFSVGATFVMR